MSKVVYLFGAGASYGERFERNALDSGIGFGMGGDLEKELYKKASNIPLRGCIKRGLPVVNELEDTIARLLDGQNNTVLDSNKFNTFIESCRPHLEWLKECCHNYPTIDTYAKQLFVVEGENGETYLHLKYALSLLFTLLQSMDTRDLRYDAFIAALVDKNGCLSKDVSILSWNYDSQIELAYSGFMQETDRRIDKIWDKLNVLSKTIPSKTFGNNDVKNVLSLTKLNGSALLFDTQSSIIWDFQFNPNVKQCAPDTFNQMFGGAVSNAQTTLSFAWEDAFSASFNNRIEQIAPHASALVVIGYSFPYVNREVDRYILNKMGHLSTIYVQDKDPDSVIQNLKSVLDRQVLSDIKIEPIFQLGQFIIPREL